MPKGKGNSGKNDSGKHRGDVSAVRKSNRKVVAIVVSDLHLSLKPPIARTAEPDWFAAMARQLKELRELQQKKKVPILVAGDIFDRWNSPPELINFAMENLPYCFTIPGQHDLPYHSYEDVEKSAYWTLVQAEKICHLDYRQVIEDITVHPFPWGREITPLESKHSGLQVALCHKYIWRKGSSYPNAPKESHVKSLSAQLAGYDVAFFGDNHKRFQYEGPCNILNCGGFYRRHIDELDHKPTFGLLYPNGEIELQEVDVLDDKFINVSTLSKLAQQGLEMTEFLDELRKLGEQGLDFVSAVRRYIKDNNVFEGTAKVILEAIE